MLQHTKIPGKHPHSKKSVWENSKERLVQCKTKSKQGKQRLHPNVQYLEYTQWYHPGSRRLPTAKLPEAFMGFLLGWLQSSTTASVDVLCSGHLQHPGVTVSPS